VSSIPEKAVERRRSPIDYFRAFKRVARRKAASEDSTAMTILQHLEELRIRILKSGIALIVTISISFIYSNQLIDILTAPIGGRSALVSIEVTENISVFMRVALLGGLILGMPLVLHQFFAFFAPAFSRRERRLVYFLIPIATLLFLGGVAFAWFLMLPVAVPFLTNFLSIPTDPRPTNYISFISSLLFWLGVSFEMPLIVFFLAKLKWLTAGKMLRGWRYAFLGIAAVAAAITPTIDPLNMGLVMVPLLALYIISIFFAWVA